MSARGAETPGRGQRGLFDRLPGQVLVQGAGTVVNAAGGLLVLLVLGRLLGPERFGEYVAILSAAVVALTLLEGGWPARVYRDGAGVSADAPAARALPAAATGYLLMAAVVLALLLLPYAGRQPALIAALACMTLVAAMNLVSARMRAQGRFGLEAGWQVAGRVASGVLIIAGAACVSATAAGVFVFWSLGLCVVLLLGGRRWLVAPRWRGLRAALPLTLPFLAIEVLAALLLKGDVAIVRWAGAAGETLSWYAACTRLNEAALLLFAPVGNVLLRSLRLHAEDQLRFSQLWRGGVLLAAAAGLAAVLGSVWLGAPLMALLFGEGFEAAGRLLPYTAAMLPFALGTLVMLPALLARGGERWLVALLLPAAAAMATGLVLGWRVDGPTGAAIGLAMAHALLWLAALVWLLRRAPARATGTGSR